MRVYESEVPGVGRKFELELTGGTSVVVVVHHDGRCELFRRDGPDADGEKILDLKGEQANRLGSILEGAYFESVDVDSLSVPLGEAIIEWVEVGTGSPVAGETLESSEIRTETGTSIIAIQRGEETVSNPDADTELEPGDLLVAVGTREEQAELAALVEGSA
ncbi:cation:proton antiporter regulatory subunit [Haloplanus aerogenes]|uniref:Potassium transporter TrkA n=1 Tax=Haloplanus aerogenes TaxID=660522 RepID=A0A3M0DAH8_9EURY|nr:TrkA C-terminal domain-containing protein [Haloplanus aerogenes]AZH26190.1 potassium transporter TrkA [Haloplanus aerogenes]RMB18357.1 TrkA domain protein [Haloplanus aerogenes]